MDRSRACCHPLRALWCTVRVNWVGKATATGCRAVCQCAGHAAAAEAAAARAGAGRVVGPDRRGADARAQRAADHRRGHQADQDVRQAAQRVHLHRQAGGRAARARAGAPASALRSEPAPARAAGAPFLLYQRGVDGVADAHAEAVRACRRQQQTCLLFQACWSEHHGERRAAAAAPRQRILSARRCASHAQARACAEAGRQGRPQAERARAPATPPAPPLTLPRARRCTATRTASC